MLVITMLTTSSFGSAWVKDPGEAYLKGAYSQFTAREFVQPDGVVLEDARYLGQTFNLYGEVGVAPNVQVVFDLPYTDSRNVVGDARFVNRRPGDLNLGVEIGNLSSSIPLSLQVSAKVPMYDNARFEGDKNEAIYPAIGDGQVDLTAMLAIGSGVKVGPVQGWVAFEAGYRHRTELWVGDSSNPDRRHVDGAPFSAQVGWSPEVKDRSVGWLFFSMSGIKNLARDESTREFVQLNAGAAVKISHGFAVEAGYGEMLWARNSARGGGVNVGVSWSRTRP